MVRVVDDWNSLNDATDKMDIVGEGLWPFLTIASLYIGWHSVNLEIHLTTSALPRLTRARCKVKVALT